ncbi:MAG: 6-phosphogluconolactonase [Thermoanaerobaculia bacterium]|nr:6-phosphogluconolactonase [Thermoanaerobaculia bacterium]
MIHEHQFLDLEAAAEALADAVANALSKRLAESSQATLAVSGGRTPTPFFRHLREREIPWDRVTITLVDDRWVDANHPDSNEGLVRRELLAGQATAAAFVGMKTAAGTPAAAQAEVDARLRSLRPFDVVVLGMGNDGHTASLFPGATNLADALDPAGQDTVVAIDPPAAQHSRLSMTLSTILESSNVLILLTGQEKWDTYRRARLPGPFGELPIRALLSRFHPDVQIYWAP